MLLVKGYEKSRSVVQAPVLRVWGGGQRGGRLLGVVGQGGEMPGHVRGGARHRGARGSTGGGWGEGGLWLLIPGQGHGGPQLSSPWVEQGGSVAVVGEGRGRVVERVRRGRPAGGGGLGLQPFERQRGQGQQGRQAGEVLQGCSLCRKGDQCEGCGVGGGCRSGLALE